MKSIRQENGMRLSVIIIFKEDIKELILLRIHIGKCRSRNRLICVTWYLSINGRKVMTNLEIILKSRDITLSTTVCLVKAMVFPVVMYGCESWTIKKAEHWRIDAFELWWWRRLLRVLWTARRSNQSILKEISPEYSLEGLKLKLKLQYFGYLMRKTYSL